MLWNDIAWPGSRTDVQRIVEYYRFTVPHGVLNDRLLPRAPAWRALSVPGAKALYNNWERRTIARGEGFVPQPAPVLRLPHPGVRPPQPARTRT